MRLQTYMTVFALMQSVEFDTILVCSPPLRRNFSLIPPAPIGDQESIAKIKHARPGPKVVYYSISFVLFTESIKHGLVHAPNIFTLL